MEFLKAKWAEVVALLKVKLVEVVTGLKGKQSELVELAKTKLIEALPMLKEKWAGLSKTNKIAAVAGVALFVVAVIL